MEISNFVVFNTTRRHGQMNTSAAFYPKGMDDATRMKLMREHKWTIASEVGFDINKIFIARQADQKHPYDAGTSYTLTKEDVAEYDDLYEYDVWADTVKLTPDTPECVIGFNVADAPNVIAMNLRTKEATSTFCSGAHINKEVPKTILKTLGGDSEDIVVSISPFTHQLPWIGDSSDAEPAWISNREVWNDCVERRGNLLIINQKKALLRQLIESGIKKENIIVGEDSFYNSEKYYSSQRNRMVDTFEDGRFMHGVMLKEVERPEDAMEYGQSYIKVIPTKR